MEAALRFVDEILKSGKSRYFCFCEASLLSSLIRDAALRQTLSSADAVFPDGIAMIALARLNGHAPPARIPGPSFLLAACAYGVERGWRHFFYGGAPGVADRLAARLRERYPGIIIAGTHSPPFRPLSADEELADTRRIALAKPDLLWVCLGSPKQERWCADHVGRIKVPLMLAVGAAFDFHSNERPWAPVWIRKAGLEWLFRALTGGRKTFIRNVKCVTIVGMYLIKTALRGWVTRRRCDNPKLPVSDKD
jgi:N-acetylglucosaminyldiphosphoundecaprenol N-acetyl-beta-D-mannosaminyltransferase